MSYILDALRKSESERQREAPASFARTPQAAVRHRIPAWIWLLISLLSLALIALALVWWRGDAPGPGIGAEIQSEPAGSVEPPVESRAVVEPPTVTRAVAPAAATAEAPTGAAAEAATSIRPISELGSLDPGLPTYRLELIAHNGQDPTAGSAWINGRRYYVGERIGTGPELVEVRPDSVVLAYRGSRFLLTTR